MFSKFFALLLLVTLGQGYIQEVQIHDSLDSTFSNYHTFRTALHDLTTCYNVTAQICTKGYWIGYSDKEFEGLDTEIAGTDDLLHCIDAGTSGIKSIRHGGNINTTVRAISVYPQEGFQGEEQVIRYGQLNGLLSGKAFVFTGTGGTDEWSLYEEQNFNTDNGGKVVCATATEAFRLLEVFPIKDVTAAYAIPQIGSVHGGCTLPERERARAQYLASLNQ